MKIGDILAIDDPVGLAHGLFRRLIPLAQGERFDELPGAAQGFFCVFEWRAPVGNGGHHQYFTNSSGLRGEPPLTSESERRADGWTRPRVIA